LGQGPKAHHKRREIMKAVLSMLLALAVITGFTLAASADDYDNPSDVFKRIERNLP
jgi:hypothetical protein